MKQTLRGALEEHRTYRGSRGQGRPDKATLKLAFLRLSKPSHSQSLLMGMSPQPLPFPLDPTGERHSVGSPTESENCSITQRVDSAVTFTSHQMSLMSRP